MKDYLELQESDLITYFYKDRLPTQECLTDIRRGQNDPACWYENTGSGERDLTKEAEHRPAYDWDRLSMGNRDRIASLFSANRTQFRVYGQ